MKNSQSTYYQVRTHDKSTVLSSGLSEEDAILSLCNDYGLTLDEISSNIVCYVVADSCPYIDPVTHKYRCRYVELIKNSMSVGTYVQNYMN